MAVRSYRAVRNAKLGLLTRVKPLRSASWGDARRTQCGQSWSELSLQLGFRSWARYRRYRRRRMSRSSGKPWPRWDRWPRPAAGADGAAGAVTAVAGAAGDGQPITECEARGGLAPGSARRVIFWNRAGACTEVLHTGSRISAFAAPD